ncbi:MAG: hypothetical protein HW383_798 [Candidatus Magasanikbacteria bacterium]|nr:hypothetical protein [Candidatus Magasanikbacteria bacterium]
MPKPQHKSGEPLRHPEQRVGVFIDVQNMYYSARNLYNAKVHFGNIVAGAAEGRKLIRAIAYTVRTPAGEERPFFEALYNLGLEVKEIDLQVFFGGAKKADWDVGIAVDTIRISPALDVVVLVSGDGDFLPLIEYLQHSGKLVEVMAFKDTAASKCIEAADAFIDLGAETDRFLITGRQPLLRTVKLEEPEEEKIVEEEEEEEKPRRRTKRTIM